MRFIAFPARNTQWEFRKIERFDAEVEALFRQCYHGEICIERSARWLNWRLFDNPRCAYEVIGAYAGGRLEGYIAILPRFVDGKLDTVEVADWLINAQYGDDLFRRLLAEVVRKALSAKASFVRVTILAHAAGRRLRGLGFVAQSNDYLTAGLRVADKAVHAGLHDGSQWFLTDANTDTDRS
jgi:hypothetical protein